MSEEKKQTNIPKPKKSRISSNKELLLELFLMIKQQKKWWLLPLLFVLAFLSIFVNLAGNSSILPAIYALF